MTRRKGIILAAGRATRLHPATLAFGKQMLPVFDKPMVYYPLSTLFLAGIRDILLVTAPRDRALAEALLGDGSDFGVSISYAEQQEAKGIADAFLVGEKFLGGDPACLILGDNFFHGGTLSGLLARANEGGEGATIFCTHVDDPRAFGVAQLEGEKVTGLVEKPASPVSNWAVTGLYFYDGHAAEMARALKPSARGELEITDLNIKYMEQGRLRALTLGAECRWFDMGTHDAMLDVGAFVREEERKTGAKVGCPFETAFRMGFIDKTQLSRAAGRIQNKPYADYLRSLAA